jgi:hypothetical protein
MEVLKFNYGDKYEKISTILIIGLLMSLTSCMTDAIKDAKDAEDKKVEKGSLMFGLWDIGQAKVGSTANIKLSLIQSKNVNTPVQFKINSSREEYMKISEIDGIKGSTICALSTDHDSCKIKVIVTAIPDITSGTKVEVQANADGYQEADSGSLMIM